MNRRQFMQALLVGGVARGISETSCAAALTGAPRPNLLFVFPDQWRGQALGFLGEEPVLTPHLDRFATPWRRCPPTLHVRHLPPAGE
jgi:hypothetical protein